MFLVANVGFDTAENEPYKVCPIERCSSESQRRGQLRRQRGPEPRPDRAGGTQAPGVPEARSRCAWPRKKTKKTVTNNQIRETAEPRYTK